MKTYTRSQIVFPKTRVVIPAYRYERCDTEKSSGVRSIPDGQEELYYETAIDLDALDRMARHASRNKSLKSHHGPLTVRILARRKLEGGAQ